QGQESTQDEKEASALHAVALDDKYDGAPVQVRVVQGKEPSHFMKIFEGQFIIHSGGKSSGFNNLNEKDFYDTDGIRFYQIQSLSATHVKAVQVLETASVLNSGDTFFLECPEDVFIWVGKGANKKEIEMANNTAKMLSPSRTPIILQEGHETDIFWNALGGYKSYGKFKVCEEIPPSMEPRLFQVSNASGSLKVEEIIEFTQDDLDEDDVMILDTND
ncbi:gelsolin-like protein, partial [Salmonella sp. s51228]|uniref:gelsolin-like protein n=1 Tax=Salmonella sp. s51228 TaxID=3159652 RepID=UPI00397F708D